MLKGARSFAMCGSPLESAKVIDVAEQNSPALAPRYGNLTSVGNQATRQKRIELFSMVDIVHFDRACTVRNRPIPGR